VPVSLTKKPLARLVAVALGLAVLQAAPATAAPATIAVASATNADASATNADGSATTTTTPPATDPPATTDPPTTDPPTTEPATTEPATTDPPSTDPTIPPPTTEPPTTASATTVLSATTRPVPPPDAVTSSTLVPAGSSGGPGDGPSGSGSGGGPVAGGGGSPGGGDGGVGGITRAKPVAFLVGTAKPVVERLLSAAKPVMERLFPKPLARRLARSQPAAATGKAARLVADEVRDLEPATVAGYLWLALVALLATLAACTSLWWPRGWPTTRRLALTAHRRVARPGWPPLRTPDGRHVPGRHLPGRARPGGIGIDVEALRATPPPGRQVFSTRDDPAAPQP
jgi:hypothetical protein